MMTDFCQLSRSEYEQISSVLKRDLELRSAEEVRIRELKQELMYLRKKAALKPGLDSLRNCAYCLTEFGHILNRGAFCPLCLKKICKRCRCYADDGYQWFCIYCYKQLQLKAVSGEWRREFSRLSFESEDSPADQLQKVLLECKELLDSDIDSSPSRFATEAAPEKPVRLHIYESSAQLQEETVSNHDAICIGSNAEPSIEASMQGNHTSSSIILSDVSPWKGINPEPSIPERIDRSCIQQFQYSKSMNNTEYQSANEGTCVISNNTCSTSKEIMDDRKSHIPVSLSQKRRTSLDKLEAIIDSNSKRNGQPDIGATDNGVCSSELMQASLMPDLPSDINLPVSVFTNSGLSSNEQNSADSDRPSITDINPKENQQPSVGATDNGIYSSKLTTDLSSDISLSAAPFTSSQISSNEQDLSDSNRLSQSTVSRYLTSESSVSEAEDDYKSQNKELDVLFKKMPLKSQKSKSPTGSIDEKYYTTSADESGNSLRSSPHGRLRIRNRSLSGGSENGRQRKSIPQISVPEYSEAGKLSTGSCSGQDEDLDQSSPLHSISQMSLSSFGGVRSESVTSVYSAAGGRRFGTTIVTGDVCFNLNYNYKSGCLEINVKECRNLAAVDTKRNRSDPYVKVYLLPDRTKSGKRKTKVKKQTLNPVFDELLKFHITVSEMEIRTLWLSVWHSDRFGRNDFLGEVMLPLGADTFENPGLKWYPLQERLESLDAPVSYKGDIILALKYVPPDVTSRKLSKKAGIPVKGNLEVLVKEARNLMATRSNGTSDPFCKSYLLPDKSKGGKQKTPVFKKSCNPKWNHTFIYEDLSLDDLRERCLELTIWDYDKITSNDFLGGVRLCLGTGKYQGRDVDWMDSVGEERSLWYTMLERPNTWVDGSLLLRPTMQSRRNI